MRGIPRGWFVILSTLLISAAVVLSCTSPVKPGSKVPRDCASEAELLAAQKTDILFVIDNSSSMKEEQEGIATELPLFIEELRKGAGTTHDFQVGVITTSVYLQYTDPTAGLVYAQFTDQSGKLQAVPIDLPDGGKALTTERVITSSDPDLVDKFRRLVRQGTL